MKIGANFKLNIKTELSSADFKVLIFLYQPLMGINAYSMYNTFYHLAKQKEAFSHQLLFDLLNISLKDFVETREKLEALGLLETYEKDKEEFLYILKPPYSANKFLKETFLGAYLESEIGSDNLKTISTMFKVEDNDKKEFNNITKSFDDLYHFKSNKVLNIEYQLEDRNGNNTKMIKNGINYYEFVEKVPRAFKSPQLFNDNFKQKLVQLAYVYQFSIDDLVNVYEKAHQGRSRANFEQISFQAKQYYESLNKEIYVQKNEISDEEVLNNVPYLQIIEKYSKGDVLEKANALNTINEFINQNDIMQGTLNVLLIFILKNKEGILPHVNYLNTVWRSWSNKGVKTAGDALKHQKDLEKSYQGVTQTKKTVNKPEWIEKYLKELEEMEG